MIVICPLFVSCLDCFFRFGVLLFITTEIFLFISFFWRYFYLSLNPNFDLGSFWPPFGLKTSNPKIIPLYGTFLLLSSGFYITFSHYKILLNSFKISFLDLYITIFLGFLFLDIQIIEYFFGFFILFSFFRSSFGNIFFCITGLHGSHVLVGLFLLLFRFYFLFPYTLLFIPFLN